MRLGVKNWDVPYEPPKGPAVEAAPAPACHHSDPATHETALCQMTKAQLFEKATALGLTDLKRTIRKAELIELIEGVEA